jgi:FlaA1/EpsC-like NDP-sugar epimerase
MGNKFGQFMSKNRKQLLVAFDIVAIILAYIIPWIMIQGRVSLAVYFPTLIASCFYFVCCFEITFALMGSYDSLWRYAEIVEFFRLVVACALAVAAFMAGTFIIFPFRQAPLSIFFLCALFATAITLYSRLTYRMYRNTRLQQPGRKRSRRVMVIGAGEAAATLLHEQLKNPDPEMNIICVVDDASEKVGRNIMGTQIMGTTEKIPELAVQCEIDTIVLAIPSLEDDNRQRILKYCQETKCNLRILPDLRRIMSDGGDLSNRIREVRVEDLLGRETVDLSNVSLAQITDKVVLVTGGGGSIGCELCRQIAAHKPRQLIILDIYENSVYTAQQDLLREYGEKLQLNIEICSVRDSRKMDAIFARYKPDIVYHAAAHKHVPLME